MPKPSRFFTVETSEISEIATRLQRRMRKLRLSVAQLSKKCSIIAGSLADEKQPTLSRTRIAKILMNRGGSSGRSAARVIARSELIMLARALGVSVEWLSGRTDNEDPIVWNLLAEPERSGHILHLLEEHEDRATEVTVWSEYLLCSFVTQEFMYAFHQVHFSELDALEIRKEKVRLVEFFNKMGNSRRTRILRPDRLFVFTSLINRSELQSIATGKGIYRRIAKSVRKRCLENLVTILKESSLKLNLVIVDDEKVEKIRSSLRDFETVGVIGDLFSIWNYHTGNIGWSEHPKYVGRYKNLLRRMQQQAIHRDASETCEYLHCLVSKI
jgi:transcriptional regulator with XRE-family HTH domain